MRLTPRPYLTRKRLRDAEKPWHHLGIDLDFLPIWTRLPPQRKPPQHARHVDEERALGDMHAGTRAPARAVGEVVAREGVGDVHVVRC